MLCYTQRAAGGELIEIPLHDVVAQGATAYQEYLFFHSAAYGLTVALDGDIQSCAADEALYHEPLVHPAMLWHRRPRRVLIMGGGEGATAREVLRHPGVESVVMVDIDADFVALCRQHLAEWNRDAFADPRLEVVCQDINAYLDAAGEPFDVVIGDLVDFHDAAGDAAALYSSRFYAGLRRRLAPGAIIATQAGALSAGGAAGHAAVRASLATQFAFAASYGLAVPSFHHLWSYVIASQEPLPEPGEPPWALFRERTEERGVTLPATGPAALAGAFALPAAIRRRLSA